jgi:hypothetical protein
METTGAKEEEPAAMVVERASLAAGRVPIGKELGGGKVDGI